MPTEEQTYRGSIDDKLELILVQTTKTNGRVTRLERWQSYVLGFCAALTILLLPIVIFFVQLLIQKAV